MLKRQVCIITKSQPLLRSIWLTSTASSWGGGSRYYSNQSRFPSQQESDQLSTLNTKPRRKRIVVAVTGAGAPLALQHLNVETHLILSKWGSATLKYELEAPKNTSSYLQSLATKTYSPLDVSATLSSGSFRTDGMIVIPCSMKTLAGIRMGYDSDLITRAASVTLKEKRRLLLVARETPLNSIHLENMLGLANAGAVIFPPVMAFYMRPKGIQDLVDQSVKRMIDLLDLRLDEHYTDDGRWAGFEWEQKKIGDN